MKRRWTQLRILLLGSAGILAVACAETTLEVTPTRPLTDYYPLATGTERYYDAYDTTYTRVPVLDTLESQSVEYETIVGPVTDALGRSVQQLDRFSAPTLGDLFAFEERWEVVEDDGFMEQLANNLRVRVLRSPIEADATWNGNALNNLGEQTFRYVGVDTTVVRNGISYPNCLYIEQRKITDSLVDSVFTYEIYAPGIGLLERYDRQLIFVLDPEGRELDMDNSYIHRRTLLPVD